MLVKRYFAYRFLLVLAILSAPLTLRCQDLSVNILKARALGADLKFDSAIIVLNSVISTYGDAQLYIERAETFLAANKVSEAISDFTKGNSLSAGSGEYGLARAYALKGDVNTALYHLEKNLLSVYKKKESEVMLDPAFGAISKSAEWRTFIGKDWYSDIETSLSEIDYYLKIGKTGDAMEILTVLLRDYPENHGVQYASAMFDYSVGKYSNTINTLSKLVVEEPGNTVYRGLLAKAKQKEGNFAGASILYSELISENVVGADLFLGQAECFYKLGEYAKAASNINNYLSVFPNDKEALGLAATIKTAAGDYIEAIKIYSKQIEGNQDDPQCFADRGDVYFMAKSWLLAANDYGMALDLNPNNGIVWLNKGIAHINLKQVDMGCYCLGKAAEKGEKQAVTLLGNYCE